MSVVFENIGEIDPQVISLMGVNVKTQSDSAIGFFGTGLKYSIAVLVRENCNITIYSGDTKYTFSVSSKSIRNKLFEVVEMNGQPIGFTTELGKNWSMYDAYRELYSNMKDEDGIVYIEEDVKPEAGKTKIVVDSKEFESVHKNRNLILIEPGTRELLAENDTMKIYSGRSECLFFRDIKVYTLDPPSMYTYSINEQLELTEDRTCKYPYKATAIIMNGLMRLNDAPIIKTVLTATKGTFEHYIGYSCTAPEISQTFKDVTLSLVKEFNRNLNTTAIEACNIPMSMAFEGVDHINKLHKVKLERAVDFVLRLGLPITDYPIIVKKNLGLNVFGRVFDGTIYISENCLDCGIHAVVGTLIEEYIHVKNRVYDCTREMQEVFLQLLIKLGEKLLDEPL